MRDVEQFKLRFGRYRTLRFRYHAKVVDEVRDELEIVGLSGVRIAWPFGCIPDNSNRTLVI